MKDNSKNFSIQRRSYKNYHTRAVFSILSILVTISISILYPRTAEAGLFSFLSVTTGEASAKVNEEPYIPNSQNMTLLRAVVNADPNAEKTVNRSIAMATENALMAEIGPSGSISDIDNQTSTEISLYTVRSGDTLSEIAELFDVSINTILWANNLDRKSTIKEGQTLIILPISGIRHTVKKGETIRGIVLKYKADLNEVLVYNDLSLDSIIKAGDIVMVPDAEPTALQTSVASKANTNTSINNASGPSYLGYYMRPISGGKKSQGIHGHNGVDLAAPVGTPIYASASGTVIANMTGGWNGGYGNYVIISHANGTQTLYSHNSVNLVSVGQRVEKGDTIAKIGMTGKTTGPHVHFEIRGAKNPF